MIGDDLLNRVKRKSNFKTFLESGMKRTADKIYCWMQKGTLTLMFTFITV
jgi:hypothetical protein